jgi:hypothetical protein
MLYASALADGVHNLMTMASDPAPVRMRRIIAKLGQVPALIGPRGPTSRTHRACSPSAARP